MKTRAILNPRAGLAATRALHALEGHTGLARHRGR